MSPTPAEIRQAVAFGRQAMLREVVDMLHAERRRMDPKLHSDDTRWGMERAAELVARMRIEGEPKR